MPVFLHAENGYAGRSASKAADFRHLRRKAEKFLFLALFFILYICSIFDKHIDSKRILCDRDIQKWNNYTKWYDCKFGFPITSEDEDIIYEKWLFYSEYPSKFLKRKATFNVYPIIGKTDIEIKKGLFSGIYYEED